MDDQRDWLMLGIIAALTTVASILKEVSKGAALSPRPVLMRLVARALWTGIGAAGVWSAITEFRELNPASAVAISAAVTMLGVDFIERALEQLAVRRLDVEATQPIVPTPPKQEVNKNGPDPDPDVG